MTFYVYMLASQRNGTLYIGSTDSLTRRIWEHQQGEVAGFAAKFEVKRLVWFERHGTREDAFRRERRMKKWNRAWKIAMIERFNPGWRNLSDDFQPE